MEFGKLSRKELEKINFKLPKEPAFNTETLKLAKPKKQAVYIGCAKWGRKEWIGKIYPKGTKEKDFLEEYGKHFNSIELNATNYQFYSPQEIANWVSKISNKQFRFCPKAHRAISFFGTNDKKEGISRDFFSNMSAFGKLLGPVFMTIDQRHVPEKVDEFFKYLKTIPQKPDFFVELRNAEFFSDENLMNDFFEKLRNLKIGTVITDTAGRQDCLHMHLSIPKAFIRFVGNSLHPSDYKRIDNWVQRVKLWLAAGVEEIYFFMHMHDEAFSPELSQYLVKELNKKCGLQLDEIRLLHSP